MLFEFVNWEDIICSQNNWLIKLMSLPFELQDDSEKKNNFKNKNEIQMNLTLYIVGIIRNIRFNHLQYLTGLSYVRNKGKKEGLSTYCDASFFFLFSFFFPVKYVCFNLSGYQENKLTYMV